MLTNDNDIEFEEELRAQKMRYGGSDIEENLTKWKAFQTFNPTSMRCREFFVFKYSNATYHNVFKMCAFGTPISHVDPP